MLKSLPTLTLILLLIWLAPVNSMPVPTHEYMSYRKLFLNQVFSPFFELTAYSHLNTLIYLLSEELSKDVIYELTQLPDHIWQSLKTTIVSSLPGYLCFYLAIMQSNWQLSGKTIWILSLTLHRIFMALTFYQVFRPMLDEPVHLDYRGDINTDSLLLNSMIHLYFDPSDNLHVSPKPWSVPPSLSSEASLVTLSLIRLHQQMLALELDDCRLSTSYYRADHQYLEFICSNEDALEYEGELELYTNCTPVFTSPSEGEPQECAISLLQPEILDCLSTALSQGSNPLHSSHACAITRQTSVSDNGIVVITLSTPAKPVHANFLIAQDEQWFLITGQFSEFTDINRILEKFPFSGTHWPVFSSNWQKLLSPIQSMAHQLTRTFALHTVHSAHQRFFSNRVTGSLPDPHRGAPVPFVESKPRQLQRLSTHSDAPLIPTIEIVEEPDLPPPSQISPLLLASSLLALRHDRRGSFTIKDSISPISSLPRRGSLPLPGQAGSRRGSLTFKDAAGLMINLQKTTLKPGRFVNAPDKILAHPKQGMVEDHFNTIRDISRLLMQAIFFRMVNPENKDLVPLLLPSKGLGVKPKSGDWNWGCGFLPEDPSYSKLTAMPEKIESARSDILMLYHDYPDLISGQQLELTTKRMNKLLKYSTALISQTDREVEAQFLQDGIIAHQIARYETDKDRWLIFNADGTPFNVIAHPIYGPYIADYDLLMIAVPMSHFYLQPVSEEHYGMEITERFTVNNEGLEEFLDSTQTLIKGDDIKTFVPNSYYSSDSDGKVTLVKRSLHLPRRYIQNQHFKPLELGDADRLKLPMIAPWLVLDYVRPRLIKFADTLGITESELHPLLQKATSDNYKVLHSTLLKGLLQTYRPDHGTDFQVRVLSHVQPEYLPETWQHRYPDTEPVFPKKPHQYRRTSRELQAVYHARSFLLVLQDLEHYLAKMDKTVGNLTPRMHQLVKQVNIGIDRGQGLAMVHHGCDSANPFSKPGDVCPTTGLLPFKMGAEETVFVTELDAIEQLISTLKGHGFYVHINPLWQLHGNIRSSRFEWALNCFEQKNDDQYHPNQDPLAKEIQLTERLDIGEELETKLGGCLAPYLYEPFVDESDTFLHHPVGDQQMQINSLKDNPAQDIGN